MNAFCGGPYYSLLKHPARVSVAQNLRQKSGLRLMTPWLRSLPLQMPSCFNVVQMSAIVLLYALQLFPQKYLSLARRDYKFISEAFEKLVSPLCNFSAICVDRKYRVFD
jgi:hypothetical protein